MLLITGGLGYIGSHVSVQLLASGYPLLIIDNLTNSSIDTFHHILQLGGTNVRFIKGDIRDRHFFAHIFKTEPIEAVLHFAGLKSVGESTSNPLAYFETNLMGSLILLQEMANAHIKTLIFSSSATVYGSPKSVPVYEYFPTTATNPYGSTKLMFEKVLQDVVASNGSWRIATLRYFNPVGAHASGLLGDTPLGTPSNLMPYVSQVASGALPHLIIFGNDYNTKDGTGIRDYIHITDLALGHIAALRYIQNTPGLITVNLGTGQGYSVLEVVRTFEYVTHKKIPFIFTQRRPGDVPESWANVDLAKKLLNWNAKYDIERMCQDSWNRQLKSASRCVAL